MNPPRLISAEQEALLQAIVAEPDDDTVRLVYADWLEQHGDAAQAAFIRSSIQLGARTPHEPRRASLSAELRKVTETHGSEWLAAMGVPLASAFTPEFVRGCVEGLEFTSLTPFFAAAPILFRLSPIRRLHFWWQYSEGLNERTLPRLAQTSELSRIRSLRLANYDTGCPTDAWRTFFQSPYLSELRFLGIYVCEFSDPDAEVLAASPSLARLTGLSLADNNLGIPGVWALLRSPHLANLTKLGLAENIAEEDSDPLEYEALVYELESRFPGQNPLENYLDDLIL